MTKKNNTPQDTPTKHDLFRGIESGTIDPNKYTPKDLPDIPVKMAPVEIDPLGDLTAQVAAIEETKRSAESLSTDRKMKSLYWALRSHDVEIQTLKAERARINEALTNVAQTREQTLLAMNQMSVHGKTWLDLTGYRGSVATRSTGRRGSPIEVTDKDGKSLGRFDSAADATRKLFPKLDPYGANGGNSPVRVLAGAATDVGYKITPFRKQPEKEAGA